MAGKGGKNRKFGRNDKSPSMARYKGERRDLRNKAKRVAKHAKQVKEDAAKVATMRVPRGTARAKRRA